MRLSEAEYAQLAVAAREADLTPTGYLAELTVATAGGIDPPARNHCGWHWPTSSPSA